MKKLPFILPVVIFLYCIQTAYASGFSLFVEQKTANAGETAEINLTLSDNPGIIAALFELDYDKERLELIQAKDNKLLPGAVFSQRYDASPYVMLWNSSSAKNFTTDGVLATLTFKVLDDAKPGKALIKLSHRPDDIFNTDLENVEIRIENGAITIPGKGANTPSGGSSGGSLRAPSTTMKPQEANRTDSLPTQNSSPMADILKEKFSELIKTLQNLLKTIK